MNLAIIAVLTIAAPPKLSVGDKAPPLAFGEAIKGNPVRAFNPKKVTVVEFWATWCGPCIQGAPHFSEMAARYKEGADFVSVSVMENDQKLVKPLVDSQGDKMAYPIALDKIDSKGRGFMHRNWLEAAGQKGIPVAFIVDREAKIAWIGYPALMEEVLAKVIGGKWDAKAYKAKFDADKKDEDASARLINEAYDKISGTPRRHAYGETVKWIGARRSKYEGVGTLGALDEFGKLFSAFDKRDYETALQMSESETKNGVIWTYFRPMLLVARIDALQNLKRQEWRELVRKTIDGPPDPNVLMALADAMSLPESKLAIKDPALAMKAGEKLASMARVPMFLLRLAWAQYANGQTDAAKATLKEAFAKMDVEKKRNPGSYDRMLKNLKEAESYFERRHGGTPELG